MDNILAQQGMTDSQKMMFQSEYSNRQKDATVAILLALFLGGFGGHRFYLGQNGLGIFYILFCWTFIPSFIAFIELFLLSGRVRNYNSNIAKEVALEIKAIA